jgi:hypothetical protein
MFPSRAALAGLAALFGIGISSPAHAYPWMINHAFTSCGQCHVDPSGGGVMTEYGRAQAEIVLRTRYPGEPENPGPVKDFLFGAVKLPEEVLLQADVRPMVIPRPGNVQAILMQADLRGAVVSGPFTASASIGTVSRGAEGARVSSGDTWNLVAREYWAGANLGRRAMVKVGRMNLPFGLRTENHILDVRDATRTDLNDGQQVGASLFYNTRKWRAEVMGIAGNFQVRPDSFRERGYSLYTAYAPTTRSEIGVSSLLAASKTDLLTLAPRTRMAEGLFARWSPVPAVAVLAEADLLLDRRAGTASTGFVSTAVVDVVPRQGLHLQAIGEQCDPDFTDAHGSGFTGTGALQWFFLPHADLRLDAGYGTVYCTPGAQASPFGLIQAHFFL